MEDDDRDLVYIGTDSYEEEYYIKLGDDLDGWSFVGLRPKTEDELRAAAKDTEITDLYSVPPELERYIDHEAFERDQEEDWLDKHDSQGEQERNGETYYLGSGSGTDIFNYFDEHEIRSYEDFTNHFDEVNLTEQQFNELIIIMEHYKKNKEEAYKIFMKWQRHIPNHPEEDGKNEI